MQSNFFMFCLPHQDLHVKIATENADEPLTVILSHNARIMSLFVQPNSCHTTWFGTTLSGNITTLIYTIQDFDIESDIWHWESRAVHCPEVGLLSVMVRVKVMDNGPWYAAVIGCWVFQSGSRWGEGDQMDRSETQSRRQIPPPPHRYHLLPHWQRGDWTAWHGRKASIEQLVKDWYMAFRKAHLTSHV